MAGGAIPEKWLRDMSVADIHEHLSRPTRRQFLRTAGFVAGAAALGPNLWMRAARAAAAPPSAVHLSYGANPTKEMSFVWSTPGPVDHPRLSFGAADGSGTVVAAETRTLPMNLLNPMATVDTHYHHVRLAGLNPDTAYGYRLMHDGAAPTAPVSFHTAPTLAGPFTFTAFGDQGVSNSARGVVAQLGAIKPAFNLVAGDLCYADGLGTTGPWDIAEFDPSTWDQWFAQIAPATAATPWMPSLGNHDVEPGYGYQGYDGHGARLALPKGGFNDFVYTFRYGNVAVVALDPNDVSSEIPHPYSLGAQTDWVDAELGKLRADPFVDFIVVHFHHCAYCTITSHGSDGGVRRKWVPLFDKHNVDLVVNGHNHGYERTTPIRNGVPTTQAPTGATVRPKEHGTTYICAGGGGRSPNDLNEPGKGFVSNGPAAYNNPVTGVPEDAPWSVKAVANNSFIRVDVDPGAPGHEATMTITAVDTKGAAFDRVVLARFGARAATILPAPPPQVGGEQLPATGRDANLLVPAGLVVGAAAVGAARRSLGAQSSSS
ncbi:MAG: hypothetical protein QOF21_1861 [Actinomycetota bacterium]|jgi:hypothetical protein